MLLPKEAVEEFKKLFKKRFKEDLTDEEAYRRATKLLDLFKVVYGSKTKNHKNEKAK